jgi:GntR family transcriptional regulator, transcriptional repressor for pyruvate dehydrogenase complex
MSELTERPPGRVTQRRRRARDVASDLNRGIRSGRYQPGDRLPTVLSLAEHYGVAPNTAREALAQLESLGLIDIRHGAGIFVTGRADRLVFANPYDEHAGLRRALDLLATRAVLEPPLAAAAALRITADELDALAALLVAAEAFLDGSARANGRLNDVNLRFHCGIARASGNGVGADVVEVLANLYHREHLALLPICAWCIDDHPRCDHRAHADILHALAEGDGELAQRRMWEHIEGVRAIVLDYAAGAVDTKGGDRPDAT